MNQPQISIPMSAPFWSITGERTIAFAEQIADEENGVQKKQSTINAEVQAALGGKASKDELLPLIYAAMVL